MTFDPNNRPEQWATYTEYGGFEVWAYCWQAVHRLTGEMVTIWQRGAVDHYRLPPNAMLYNKNPQGTWIQVPLVTEIKKDTKSIIASEQESAS